MFSFPRLCFSDLLPGGWSVEPLHRREALQVSFDVPRGLFFLFFFWGGYPFFYKQILTKETRYPNKGEWHDPLGGVMLRTAFVDKLKMPPYLLAKPPRSSKSVEALV